MVKKIIHTGDLHIRNLDRLDETQEIFGKFIEECQTIIDGEESVDDVRIVICGDVVESKIHTSNESNLALAWFFRELDKLGCEIYVIGGNHDMLMTNLSRVDCISMIVNIGTYEHIHYLDAILDYQSGYYVDDNIVWCLYSSFSDFNRPDIKEAKVLNENKTLIGLIHADINGGISDTGRMADKGLELSIFDGLDVVMAGHIHKYQELKYKGIKCVYCGSMIQQNFGENKTGHGYVIWDVENLKHELKEIDNEERGFYQFTIDCLKDIEEDKENLINL